MLGLFKEQRVSDLDSLSRSPFTLHWMRGFIPLDSPFSGTPRRQGFCSVPCKSQYLAHAWH